MSKNIELDALIESIASHGMPLTVVCDGRFPLSHVRAFMDNMKATGDKTLRDCATAFCYGNAGTRRVNWTYRFKGMVCEHFGFESFDDAFTEEGRKGQAVYKEIHKNRAKKTNLHRKAGKTVRDIANTLHQLAKRAELHSAKIETIEGGYFRLEMKATVRRKTKKYVVIVGSSDNCPFLGL